MLLCLLSFATVVAAAPQPHVSLQLMPHTLSGFDQAARESVFDAANESVTAEVWGRGQLRWHHLRMLLRASTQPADQSLSTQTLSRLAASDGYWRLKTSARVLRRPQERRVRLELRQVTPTLQLSGGLEALDADLAPKAGFRKRMVRRFGPSAGMRWQPFGSAGRGSANTIGACARLWPLSPAGPVWDLAASITTGWTARTMGQPTVWGQAAVRGFTGGEALLAGGDFVPGDGLRMGAPSASSRILRTQVRGFEDATWYTTRQANVAVGLCVQPRSNMDVEVFSAAGTYAAASGDSKAQPDVLRHATGAAMQVRSRIAGKPVLLRYQVALRHQGSRQPVLHMVTASL